MILLECDGCHGTTYLSDFVCPNDWAKVELEGQTIYFHDRELGDCYDCWLLSPITESEKGV